MAGKALAGSVTLSCGRRMAYQRWGNSSSNSNNRIICSHGWLDNSNSFSYLGPYLGAQGYDVIAIDYIGHGRSDHLPEGVNYSFPSYISHLKSFLDEIQWSSANVIGHSMGAGISMILSGIYPEMIQKCILIDGFGPITTTAAKSPSLLRKAIEQENAYYKRSENDKKKVYDNVSKAIDARVRNVSSYPGKQYLSREAATSLVTRGTQLVVDNNNNEDIDENNPNPVVFRHDPRLFLPSYTYFSNEQILNFIDGITAKTLLIQGKDGWPVDSQDLHDRKEHFKQKGLLSHLTLPGSHHLHIDPTSRVEVGIEILNFLKQ